MNVRRFSLYALSVIVGGAALATVPVIAHHSSAPFYDATKSAEAQGPVTKLLLRNPHSFLYFESDVNGKKVEWQVELGPAASLTRTGWTTDTLKPGTVIKVVGQPSRAEGSFGMCCRRSPVPMAAPIQPGGRVMEEQQPPR
ncbi:MAG: DUF6152 family protein [Vicinamibacterales bacterium]